MDESLQNETIIERLINKSDTGKGDLKWRKIIEISSKCFSKSQGEQGVLRARNKSILNFNHKAIHIIRKKCINERRNTQQCLHKNIPITVNRRNCLESNTET